MKSNVLNEILNKINKYMFKVNYKLVHGVSCQDFIKNNSKNLYNFLYNNNNDSNNNYIIDLNVKYLSKFCNIKSYLYDNNFLSKNIRDTILLKYNYLNYYKSHNIELFLFRKDEKENNKLLKNIFNITYIIKKLTNNNKVNKIIIFPTEYKKILPNKFKILGPDECNSGATFYNFNRKHNGVIIIWRIEELYKVLIHELLHSLFCDIHLIDHEIKIYNKFYLNEVYIETLATILNCLIKTSYHNKNIEYTRSLILKEKNHSLLQFCKIINYYNIPINNIQEYFINEFEEKTNVFSYYVMKLAILFDIPSFLNLIGYNLELNKYNLMKFYELCDLSFRSNKFNNKVQYCLKKYKDLDNSFRMTINDI